MSIQVSVSHVKLSDVRFSLFFFIIYLQFCNIFLNSSVSSIIFHRLRINLTGYFHYEYNNYIYIYIYIYNDLYDQLVPYFLKTTCLIFTNDNIIFMSNEFFVLSILYSSVLFFVAVT